MAKGNLRALDVLEQEGRTVLFHHPIGDLGDFEMRIDFRLDAPKDAALVEEL